MNGWLGWFPMLAIDASIKITIVMLAAAIATVMLRSSSAAMRHLIWQLAAASALLIPVLSVALPAWHVLPAWMSVGTSPSNRAAADHVDQSDSVGSHSTISIPIQSQSTATESARFPRQPLDAPHVMGRTAFPSAVARSVTEETNSWPALIWMIGVMACFAPVFVGTFCLWQIERTSTVIGNGAWFDLAQSLKRDLGIHKAVFLLSSPARSLPMTWGIFAPRLLLPAEAASWTPQRLRVVLLHELAHVKRRDYLGAWIMQCACALYWFHPLVWFALRRSQAERERACDDMVIAAGERASDYAEHLLDIASGLRSRVLAAYSAIAMARSSRLEERLHAILDQSRNRKRLTAIVIMIVVLAGVCVTVLLSSLRARQGIQATQPAQVPQPAITAAGYTPIETAIAVARPALPTTQISIDLKVTNAVDKQPVPGAAVDLQTYPDGQQSNTRGITDANGEFKIRLARAGGALRIGVIHPDYTPRAVQWSFSGSGIAPPDDYTMELSSGITIGGVVQNESGQPVEGADITFNVPTYGFSHGKSYTTRQTTRSGAQGHWTIEHAPAELRGAQFEMDHPQYARTEVTETAPEPIAQLRAQTSVLTINNGIPLAGTVRDDSGKPIAGAKIWLQGTGVLTPPVSTGADGAFSFVYGPGRKTLTVYAPGWAPQLMDIDLQPGQPALNLVLTKGQQLRARVVDGQGKPVPQTIISIARWRNGPTRLDWSTTTDANGEFVWNDAPSEVARFTASKLGFNSAQGDLKPGIRGQTLVLQVPQSISGTVVDAATGAPITRFRIYEGLSMSKGTEMMWSEESAQAVQSANGEFVHLFRGIGGYYHQIRIAADGYAASTTPVIPPEETGTKYEVKLTAQSSVGGVIRLPDGTPAAGAEVYIARSGHAVTFLNGRFSQKYTPVISGPVEKKIAAADGRFNFPADTDPTAYFLAIHEAGYAIVPVGETRKSPGVTLTRWGRIEGTLYSGGKPAPAGSYVGLIMQQQMPLDSIRFGSVIRTTQDGKFVLDRALDAIYTIGPGEDNPRIPWVNPSGAVEPIEVRAGQTVNIDIGRDGVAVTGKLIPPKELGQIKFKEPDVMISLVPVDYQRPRDPEIPGGDRMTNPERIRWMEQWYRTDAGKEYLKQQMQAAAGADLKEDGTFRIAGVKPGKYRLGIDVIPMARDGAQAIRIHETLKEFEIPTGRTDSIDLGDLDIPPPLK